MMLLKRIFFIVIAQLFALIYCNVKAENSGVEMTYLQTDRTAYITGEPIFYKMYVLDRATRKPSDQSVVGYILLRNPSSNIVLKFRVSIHAGLAKGCIALPDTLTSGVYQMVTFTSAMRNQGENQFFHKSITIVNRFDKGLNIKMIQPMLQDTVSSQALSTLEIETDKTIYNTREKVTLNLGRVNSKSNVSISVFEESGLPEIYKSMEQYFNDSSIDRNNNHIENYHYSKTKRKLLRGNVIDVKTKQKIENAIVLLTCVDTIPNLSDVSISGFEESGLSEIYKSMEQCLNDSSIDRNNNVESYHSSETKGKLLRGSVIDAKTKQKIENAIVLLSCIDTIPNLEYAVTNSSGLFQMLLTDYYAGKELFLTIKDVPENENWEIKIEDNFAQSEKWDPTLIAANRSHKEFIVKSQNIVYINKTYQTDKMISEEPKDEPKVICPRFLDRPVVTVLPSDFVSLDSFPEIAVEILPLIRVVKEQGKYHVQMVDELMKGYQKQDPAIFLDGVYLDDVNKIMPLRSEQIKKIEFTTSERAFGDLVFSGAIFITSTSNEMMNSKPAPYAVRIKNDNINPGENLAPVNSQPDTNTPFIRQLLYWNPNLELNETEKTRLEFYTSDNQAKFIIKVEGVSEDGMFLSGSSAIQVINQ